MFEEILNSHQGKFVPEAYSIEAELRAAKEYTDMHPAICDAEAELNGVPGFSWTRFSRNNLRDVWRSDRCSFSTKYIATLWWGNVYFRNKARVFSPENMTRLQAVSPRLEQALTEASAAADFPEFQNRLTAIFENMLKGGEFYVTRVSSAFFTKVLQFFFAANPVAANPGFLPIIADKWLMRAVYCEMTDLGAAELRDHVFRFYRGVVSLRNESAAAYGEYIRFFNNRCAELGVSAWDMELRLFRNQLVKARFQ